MYCASFDGTDKMLACIEVEVWKCQLAIEHVQARCPPHFSERFFQPLWGQNRPLDWDEEPQSDEEAWCPRGTVLRLHRSVGLALFEGREEPDRNPLLEEWLLQKCSHFPLKFLKNHTFPFFFFFFCRHFKSDCIKRRRGPDVLTPEALLKLNSVHETW